MSKLTLDIWYQAVVEEASPNDLSLEDKPILSFYKNRKLVF